MPEFTGRLRTPRLPSAPATPVVGELYFNTATNILYWWNGTTWVSASGGGSDNLRYNGDWAAGSYLEGDVVVDGGVSYLAVRPTSARPAAWPGASLAASGIASTATGDVAATNVQAALAELAAEKQAKSEKGVANGYASLDSGAKVPLAQLPPISGGGVDYIGNWGAGTAYKKGDVVNYNGNDYMAVNDSTGVAPPAPSTPTLVNYGTTLPTSPFHGQEAILVDSVTNPLYQWRFRYNSFSTSSYKWEFIGGPPVVGWSPTNQIINTTSTWTNIVSSSLVIPRSGEYIIGAGCTVSHPTAGSTSYLGMWYGTVTNIVYYSNFGFPVAGGFSGSIHLPEYRTTMTAGAALGLSGQSNFVGGSWAFMGWHFLPVRVS